MTTKTGEGGVVQDRRVRRTQRALAEALIALTLERGYETVTIRDITERADVGYATFFRHYPDKEALLLDVLDVVIDEVIELLDWAHVDPVASGTRLFQYLAANDGICRVLVGRGASLLVQRIVDRGTREALASDARLAEGIPPEIAAHHLVSSVIALAQWWLEHGQPYPPERMGTIYESMIFRPTHAGA